MIQQPTSNQTADPERRGRGPVKPFPVILFEEVAVLSQGILTHGIDGEMQRLTLLDKLGLSPNSSKTRNLITSSTRYGLTTGNHSAATLKVTEEGRAVFTSDSPPSVTREKKFQLSIMRFEAFKNLYEKLKGKSLPDKIVIGDQLLQSGVAKADCKKAAEVFIRNLRHVGLVKQISGSDFVISLDEVPDSEPITKLGPDRVEADASPAHSVSPSSSTRDDHSVARPSVHIDIQIHIDSTASAEQIDQIFASMAKHLYRNEE